MSILPKVFNIDELPVSPENIQKLQKFLNAGIIDNSDITNIIIHDPSLAANVLKVANSARYCISYRNHFSSVEEAIKRVGIDEIEKMASNIQVISKLDSKSNLFNYRTFLRHLITAAYLTQAVSDSSLIDFTEEQRSSLFLSGLMHDIGILIYDQFFHQAFESIVKYSITKKKSFLDAELILALSDSHAAVGSALLEIWKIDPAIISAIRFHHMPHRAPQKYENIAAVLFITEYILCTTRHGSFEGKIQESNKQVWEFLGISESNAYELYNEANARMQVSKVIYNAI